jgi:hypothetical protein
VAQVTIKAEEAVRVRLGLAEGWLNTIAATCGGLVKAAGSGARHTDEAFRAETAPAETAPAETAGSAMARAVRPPADWVTAARVTAARVPRAVWQGLVAFAAYLAAFIAWFGWPLLRHLNTPNLRQYWTDPNFYAWSMRWWPYAVSHGVNPLYSSQIGAPQGYELAWASTTPSVDLLMWPVTAASGVLVSYNVTLLLVPPVSAWAAFLVARRLTGRFWPSLLAGSVYGFCPYELVHNWQGQPNLTATALFPLLGYLMLRWWDGTLRDSGFVIWSAAAMAVEFYTFNESFFDMTAVLAGGLAIGCAVAGRAAWRRAARLARLTAVAYAGAIVAAAPYLYYALRHDPGTLSRQRPAFSLNLVRMILPWSDKVFGLKSLANYSGHLGRPGVDDYVGLPVLVVLLAIAVLTWRRSFTRLLVIGFAFVIALAVGPELAVGTSPPFRLPWAGLWSLPIARSAEPSRFIVFVALALAIALALWLAMPGGSGLLRAARWGLGLLAVAAILWDAPTAYSAVNPIPLGYRPPAAMRPANQLPPFITAGLYRRYLRPGEIVVIVTHRGNAGMLFQADAGFYFRIAGGFINASLSPQSALPDPVMAVARPSRRVDQAFADYVRSSGVGAVIVEQAWEDPWMRNFSTVLGMRGTSAGGVTVYPVAPWLANQAHSAESGVRRHPRQAPPG